MPVRIVQLFALAGLLATLVPPIPAQQPGDGPALIVRLRSVDGLLADAEYLGALAGQEETAKQLLGIVKAKIGTKGLEGIDTKKPIGLYGSVGAQGIDSTAVLMLPLADEKTFLTLLDNLNIKVTAPKQKDGIYSFTPPNLPTDAFFRIANGYLYATARDKSAIEGNKLLKPTDIQGSTDPGLFSASLRIGRIPRELKDFFLTQLERGLQEAQDKKGPDETEAQQQLKKAILKEFFQRTKTLLTDGDELTIRLDVDRKAGELSAEMSLTGGGKTKLAGNIADLTKAKSIFPAALGSNPALSVLLHVDLPEDLRKTIGPVFEEGFAQGIKKQKDENKRANAEKFLKALSPTIQSGGLSDVALSMRGPNDGGKYTFLLGSNIKDGPAVDAAFKDMVKTLEEKEQARIKLDAETVGDVKIHRFDIAKELDVRSKQLFGEDPLFLAFRSDAWFAAFGPDGLPAIKEAIQSQPKAAPQLQFEMSLKKFAQAMALEEKNAPEVVQKVFGAGQNNDTIRFIVEGGKALRGRFVVKGDVLKFFAEIGKLKAAGEKKE